MSDHASLVAEIARLREAAREAIALADAKLLPRTATRWQDDYERGCDQGERNCAEEFSSALTALRNAIKGDSK